MFHQLVKDNCLQLERDVLSPFLEMALIDAFLHCSGTVAVSWYFRKISVDTRATTSAVSFRDSFSRDDIWSLCF